MGYYTKYDLTITPRPDLETIQRFGNVRRSIEGEGLDLIDGIAAFFSKPINEAIYQALFDQDIVLALGRGLDGDGERCTWYDHEVAMRKLSAAAPGYLFTLSGEGEESGDVWRKYFKNGKMQEAPAKIAFDEFDESKLA